jgi:hypothetical protein
VKSAITQAAIADFLAFTGITMTSTVVEKTFTQSPSDVPQLDEVMA